MTCNINKVSAAQNSQVSFESKNKANTDISSSNNDGMKKSTKLMLGATALATLIIGGLGLAKKGKLPNPTKFKQLEGKIEESVPKAAENAQQTVKQNISKSPLNMSEAELSEWGGKNVDKLKKLFSKKRDMTKWENGTFGNISRKDSYAFYGGKDHTVKTEIISSGQKTLYKDYDKKGNLLRVYYRNEATGLQYEASRYNKNSIDFNINNTVFNASEPKKVYGEITGLEAGSKTIDYNINLANMTQQDFHGGRKIQDVPISVSGQVNKAK